MVDLLRRNIVDNGAGGHGGNVGGVPRLVAADIGGRRVLDALLALRVLGYTSDGPVLLLGPAVDDESRKRV